MGQSSNLITIIVSQAEVKPSPLPFEEGFFSSISCATAGSITVKGTGIKTYIASGAGGTGHIDPATGAAHGGAVAADGYYEALPATAVVFPMVAGQVIMGQFTSIDSDGNFTGTGIAHSIDASGSEYQFVR